MTYNVFGGTLNLAQPSTLKHIFPDSMSMLPQTDDTYRNVK